MGYLSNRNIAQDITGILAPARGRDFEGSPVTGSQRHLGWGIWPWLLLAALFAFSVPLLDTSRSGNQASLEAYHALMTRYSDPGAVDCGLVWVPWPPVAPAPSSCLRNAYADGRPFRIHFGWDAFGHGHTTWVGYAADGKGGIWRVVYSRDTSEGYRDIPQPILRIDRCPAAQMPRGPWGC